MRFFFFWKHLLKLTAEVLGVEILKFHVSAQGFKMFSAFNAQKHAQSFLLGWTFYKW